MDWAAAVGLEPDAGGGVGKLAAKTGRYASVLNAAWSFTRPLQRLMTVMDVALVRLSNRRPPGHGHDGGQHDYHSPGQGVGRWYFMQ